ncbi:MAG TPA: hypothetical protein VIT20_00010 [Propionibacteriaceae bacterium]
MEELETLARSDGPRGEVVLRRRISDGLVIDELVVNGAFAMDSAETLTERRLGQLAAGRGRILVGGLGLGFTAAEILGLGVDRLEVVDIESCLIDWARAGITSTLAAVAADPRTQLHAADIAEVLAGGVPGLDGPWDAIVLDVDNGPDFLIHAANDALYAPAGLGFAYVRLAPGGRLLIWCQGAAPGLLRDLQALEPDTAEHLIEVVRGERRFTYAIYELTRHAP